MITHRSTRQQILVLLNSPTVETIVANTVSAVESYNKGLVEACSKLRVKSIHKV